MRRQRKGRRGNERGHSKRRRDAFLDLPDEIQELIARYTIPSAFAALRATCRHLHRLLVYCIYMSDPLNACAFLYLWRDALKVPVECFASAPPEERVRIAISHFETRRVALFGAGRRAYPYGEPAEWPETVATYVLNRVSPTVYDSLFDVEARDDMWRLFFKLIGISPQQYVAHTRGQVEGNRSYMDCHCMNEAVRYDMCAILASEELSETEVSILRDAFLPVLYTNTFISRYHKLSPDDSGHGVPINDDQRQRLYERAVYFYRKGLATRAELAAALLLYDRDFPDELESVEAREEVLAIFSLLGASLLVTYNGCDSNASLFVQALPARLIDFLRRSADVVRPTDIATMIPQGRLCSCVAYCLASVMFGQACVADWMHETIKSASFQTISLTEMSLYLQFDSQARAVEMLDFLVLLCARALDGKGQGCFELLRQVNMDSKTIRFITECNNVWTSDKVILPNMPKLLDYYVREQFIVHVRPRERNRWIMQFCNRPFLNNADKERIPVLLKYYDWDVEHTYCPLSDRFVRNFPEIAARLTSRITARDVEYDRRAFFFESHHIQLVHALRNKLFAPALDSSTEVVAARLMERIDKQYGRSLKIVSSAEVVELVALTYDIEAGNVRLLRRHLHEILCVNTQWFQCGLSTYGRYCFAQPILCQGYFDVGGTYGTELLYPFLYSNSETTQLSSLLEKLPIRAIHQFVANQYKYIANARTCCLFVNFCRLGRAKLLPPHFYRLCVLCGTLATCAVRAPPLSYVRDHGIEFECASNCSNVDIDKLVVFLHQYLPIYWNERMYKISDSTAGELVNALRLFYVAGSDPIAGHQRRVAAESSPV